MKRFFQDLFCRIQSIWIFLCHLTCYVLLEKTCCYIINIKFSAKTCCSRGPRGNHVSKVYFMVKKTKKCCKNTAAKSDEFDFVAVFLQYIFAAKIDAVMGGSHAASYIYAQCSTFLLRVDEKYSSWLLSWRFS